MTERRRWRLYETKITVARHSVGPLVTQGPPFVLFLLPSITHTDDKGLALGGR